MEGDSTGIQFTGEAQLSRADADWVHTTLARASEHLRGGVRRACIEFVRDDRMQTLHAKFSGENSTTDVLTFANNAPGDPIDCDIAVCVDQASRQAAELGHTTAQELLLYALHGLLHASGHDDRDAQSHASMHAEEDRILSAVGVGPLYAPRTSDATPRSGKGGC